MKQDQFAPASPPPGDTGEWLLTERLRRHAAATPDKPAVIFGPEQLSYAELAAAADGLAALLLDAGLVKGRGVATLLRKNTRAMVAFLGVWGSGGVLVPVDVKMPESKLRYVFELTDPQFAVVEEELLPVLAKVSPGFPAGHTIVLGRPGPGQRGLDETAGYAGGPPAVDIGPNDTVYVNFTSGTTGAPKGAVTTHANVYWNTRAAVEAFSLTADDVHMSMFPIFVHPHELFARPVHLGSSWAMVDSIQPRAVVRAIADNRVTAFMAVASIYETLLRMPDGGGGELDSLRVAESGGMHVTAALVEAFRNRFGLPVSPVWGSTEAAGIAVATPPGRAYRSGSMGRPCPHYTVRVLDPDDPAGAPARPGITGELAVGGPAVCARYLQNASGPPEILQNGLFRTGDLVQMDEDGFLYFKSRRHNLMKVGGIKVYPTEIEELLRAHPDVAEVVVVPRADPLRGEVPRAVIVPRNGSVLTRSAVRAYCEERLHPFKTPRIIDIVAELPKTPGGKVAWRELE
jgi:long-chain acyl-CoA synthetase